MKRILSILLFLPLLSFAAATTTPRSAPPVSIAGASVDGSSLNVSIKQSDSAMSDSIGRLRVSEQFGVFEDTRTDGIGASAWETVKCAGTEPDPVWNSNEATVTLSIGTGANDCVYRQTRYFPYTAGKTVGFDGTLVLGGSGTLAVCIRTSTSGSPVDTCYDQSTWNIDKLDGSCATAPCDGTNNPSGITIDVTKTHLAHIDFLWQGVGRVRFGFNIGGKPVYVHQVNHSNVLDKPFMATASLPIRYEVRNAAGVAYKRHGYFDSNDGVFLQLSAPISAGISMKQICVSLVSEGGYNPPGLEFGAAMTATRAVTAEVPVLAIRLKNTFNGKPNRKIVELLHMMHFAKTNDAICWTAHIHDPTATAGGTWVSVGADSAIEYNTGLTSITATTVHRIDPSYVLSGQGAFGGQVSEGVDWNNYHSIIHQNAASNQSQIFAEYCTSVTGTSDIWLGFGWKETK